METNKHREQLARNYQRNLEEAGCVAPSDAVKSRISSDKPAPIDTIEVPNLVVSDEDVLKYGRRIAQMLLHDRMKPLLNALVA